MKYVLDGKLPPIVADEGQVRHIVINLVSNAIQAMPGGGTLTIGTLHLDTGVEFSITDTGTGIAPEILPKIFDPYFTTKDVDQGTGLGLSVVHGIVAAHGGEINVDNNVPTGTRISVRIPHKHSAADNSEGGGGNDK